MLVGERAQDPADVVAVDLDERLAAGLGTQDGWDLHLRHGGSLAERAEPTPAQNSS